MRKTLTLLLITFFLSITIQAQQKNVVYYDVKQKLNGVAFIPQKKFSSSPGVLILPAWRGIDESSKLYATKLSQLGYTVFIADIYGEGNYPKDMKACAERAGYYKKNISEYHQRIQLALHQLIHEGANANNIAVMGYCFGGTGAIEVAREGFPVKEIISFHGGLTRDSLRIIKPITAKILVLHGADDPFISKEDIAIFKQEMRTAKADWQMVYFGNAVHSFTDPAAGNDNSKGAAFNEKASQRSWNMAISFLNEFLEKP